MKYCWIMIEYHIITIIIILYIGKLSSSSDDHDPPPKEREIAIFSFAHTSHLSIPMQCRFQQWQLGSLCQNQTEASLFHNSSASADSMSTSRPWQHFSLFAEFDRIAGFFPRVQGYLASGPIVKRFTIQPPIHRLIAWWRPLGRVRTQTNGVIHTGSTSAEWPPAMGTVLISSSIIEYSQMACGASISTSRRAK